MIRHSCFYLTLALTTSLSLLAHGQSILGSAESFAILGGSTVTSAGVSMIDGNIGVNPGTAITGFPPGSITNGAMYTGADDAVVQAHAAAITAFNFLTSEPMGTNLSGQNLGGLTLDPGTYTFDAAAVLTGTLILDTHGDPNASFHFLIGSTFTTNALASVITIGLGGAPAQNIFWRVGSSATIAGATSLEGTVIAQASITIGDGASIMGRAFAIDGAVTMSNNSISNGMAVPEPNTAVIMIVGLALLAAFQYLRFRC